MLTVQVWKYHTKMFDSELGIELMPSRGIGYRLGLQNDLDDLLRVSREAFDHVIMIEVNEMLLSIFFVVNKSEACNYDCVSHFYGKCGKMFIVLIITVQASKNRFTEIRRFVFREQFNRFS